MNTEPEWTAEPSDSLWVWEGGGYKSDTEAAPSIVVRLNHALRRAQIIVGRTTHGLRCGTRRIASCYPRPLTTLETIDAVDGTLSVRPPDLVHQRCTFDLPADLVAACETLWTARDLQNNIPTLLLRYVERDDLLAYTYYWSRYI